MNNMVYLVRAHSKNSGIHLWIGGEQSANIARAKYWNTEAEAQAIVDHNQNEFDKINKDLYERQKAHYGITTIVLEVVPMTRKELMVEILKG
ncbi:MAG: hypothetical protein ACTSPB_21315 [Candidatus Thorarchaeota archaeon]